MQGVDSVNLFYIWENMFPEIKWSMSQSLQEKELRLPQT